MHTCVFLKTHNVAPTKPSWMSVDGSWWYWWCWGRHGIRNEEKCEEGEPWWGRERGWMLASRTTDYDQWSDEKDNTEHAKDTYCSESAHLCAGRLKKGQEHGMNCMAKKYDNEKVRVAIGNQGCWILKAYEQKSHVQIIKKTNITCEVV